MPRHKIQKEITDGYISIGAVVDKLNRAFRHEKIKPSFNIEQFVNLCMKRTKPNEPRTVPFLPNEIINKKIRVLKSDVRTLTNFLLEIEKQETAQ